MACSVFCCRAEKAEGSEGEGGPGQGELRPLIFLHIRQVLLGGGVSPLSKSTSCWLMLFVLQLPDLKDAEAVQKFFLEEIQHGEELLAQGNPPPTHTP